MVELVEPRGTGLVSLYVASVMLALSWVTLIARLSVRRWLKPEAMGADDYLMCAGLVCLCRLLLLYCLHHVVHCALRIGHRASCIGHRASPLVK